MSKNFLSTRHLLGVVGWVLPFLLSVWTGPVLGQSSRPTLHKQVVSLIQLHQTSDGVSRSLLARKIRSLGPKAIPVLVKLLSSKDYQRQQSVLHVLMFFGPRAHAAAPSILPFLAHSRSWLRGSARTTLQYIGKASVPWLVRSLSHKNSLVRAQAAEVLGDLKKHASPAIPRLIPLLKDKSASVRESVVRTLGVLAPYPMQVIPVLLRLLRDSNSKVRIQAAWALGRMGTKAKAAIPGLHRALDDSSAGVREYAVQSLRVFGSLALSSTPKLIRMLKDPNASVRKAVVMTLGTTGYTKRKVVVFRQAMQDSSFEVKEAILQVLAKFLPHEQSIQNVLLLGLRDKQWIVRILTLRLFGKMEAKALFALPAILRAVNDKNAGVREDALYCIGKLGRRAVSAVPVVIQKLNDPKSSVRQAAVVALHFLGPVSKRVIDALMHAVVNKDNPHFVQERAVETLGDFGVRAKAAIPVLLNIFRGNLPLFEDDLVKKASKALAQMGPASLPYLEQTVRSIDHSVRYHSLKTLGRMGSKAISLLPYIRNALNDANKDVRVSACWTLAQMGRLAASATPELKLALKDKNIFVRGEALVALSKIHPNSSHIASVLAFYLHSRSSHIRFQAVSALINLKTTALSVTPDLIRALGYPTAVFGSYGAMLFRHIGKPSVPALLRALRHKRWNIRAEAVRVLGRIGVRQSKVLQALRYASKDNVKQVRLAARKALRRLLLQKGK